MKLVVKKSHKKKLFSPFSEQAIARQNIDDKWLYLEDILRLLNYSGVWKFLIFADLIKMGFTKVENKIINNKDW